MNAFVVAVLFFSVSTLAQDPPPPSGANVLVTAHSSAPNSNVSDAARVTNASNAVISILNSNETASPNESSSSSSFSTASSVSAVSSSDVSTSSSSASSASSSSVQSSTASSSAASEGNVTIAANADVANLTAQAVEAKVTAPIDAANPAANATVSAVSASSSVASTESSTTTSAPAETRKPVGASPDRNLRPVASGVPGLPQLATKDQSASPFIAKGAYIKTSAVEKPCKENPDCYNLREPDEWCPLPERSRYSDKGCFCDHVRFVCTIQRQSPKGEDEFTDCAEKSTSVCAGYKPVIRVQQPPQPQPQPAQQQKQEKQEQRPAQPKIKN